VGRVGLVGSIEQIDTQIVGEIWTSPELYGHVERLCDC